MDLKTAPLKRAALAWLLPGIWAVASAAAPPAGPDAGATPMPASRVVFIMTDTTRADMLNCYRNTGLKTPRLDRLASQGMRFERAYTCQPLCTPARSAIFTGLFPHTNGAWSNETAPGTDVRTIGQRLRDAGFHSAYIGKWHLDGSCYFGAGRCPDGWDPAYWYDGRRYLDELSPADRTRSRQMKTNLDPTLTAEFTYGRRCSNRAVDFLSKHSTEKFFLVVSYDEPHGPCICPRPFSEMYRDFTFPHGQSLFDPLETKPSHQRLWAGGRLKEDAAKLRAMPAWHADFFGCHSFVDDEIGRVLDAVDRHAPDALVIYTSDHGDFLRAHRLAGKGPAMYDDITRIPLIVRWPGVVPAGAVCPFPVSHIDLVPTILAAAGRPVPEILQGASLMPTLKDPAVRPHDAVFMEWGRFDVDADGMGGFQPIRAAFDGRYKLAVNLLTTDELYDLQADPEELANLIDSKDHAAVRDRLHDRILQWMNDTRDPFRGDYWACRPWRPDRRPRWAGDGMTRQRGDNGYDPRVIDYDTGMELKPRVRPR